MQIKQYELRKTAKKTAEVNELLLVEGNAMSDKKMLFDFSFLDTLDILEDEKEAIKKEAIKNCCSVNRIAFVFYNADKWTMFHAVVDFNCHRVYNSKTWNLSYVILEVKHVISTHAERKSAYDKYYTENIKELDEDSRTEAPVNDLEV